MRSARTTTGGRRRLAPLAVLSLAIVLGGCSSPLDVSAAEQATATTCAALDPMPGVESAACTVDDGGFDAGITRKTEVVLTATTTATEAHHVVTAWLRLREGGLGESEVSGSRATALLLTPAANLEASFLIAPGAPAPGVAFVQEWLGRASQGVPIFASVGDGRTVGIREDGLSPAEQAALLDDFSMQTRADRLVLQLGTGSPVAYGATSVESPASPELGATVRLFEDAYRSLAEKDPGGELEFTVSADAGSPPVLWFRIPAALAATAAPGQGLTSSSVWESIRPLLAAAAPTGADYTVGISGTPGDVIGGFSTSGCTPTLTGPQPRYGAELQAQWSAIHGRPAPETCP